MESIFKKINTYINKIGNIARCEYENSKNNVVSFLCFLFMSCFMQYSCSTTQPMTKKIDKYASSVGDISNFQYYVSTNIILTKNRKSRYNRKNSSFRCIEIYSK